MPSGSRALDPPRSPMPASASPWEVSASEALPEDEGGTLLMPCVMYSSTSSRETPWAASNCAAYDLDCWSVAARTSPDWTS